MKRKEREEKYGEAQQSHAQDHSGLRSRDLAPFAQSGTSRRAWIFTPFVFAGLFTSLIYRPKRALPDPAANGSGELVSIVLFSNKGSRLRAIQVRRVVKSGAEWRHELSSDQFAVARGRATEFPYHNLYWKQHVRGMYRCVCCGNALFRSDEKFDSGTGWPSFLAPAAPENIALRSETSLGFERIEVLCSKCEAHLGHVFDDGPPPAYKRFCLNSAALLFNAA